jgi:hypothetical protein
MRNLSEILNDMEMLETMRNDIYSDEYIDPNEKDMMLTDIDLSFVLPVILVKKYAYVNPTSNNSTKNIPVTLTIIFCLLFMNFFPPFTYKKII